MLDKKGMQKLSQVKKSQMCKFHFWFISNETDENNVQKGFHENPPPQPSIQ